MQAKRIKFDLCWPSDRHANRLAKLTGFSTAAQKETNNLFSII